MIDTLELELRQKRFISDHDLPIQNPHSPFFDYFLDLYEKDYKSRTLWEKTWEEINEKCEGRKGKFLHDFYKTRDEIIRWGENSDAYKEFIGDDKFVERFKLKNTYQDVNIYTTNSLGKRFLQIDLKSANFQALRFYNPALVRDTENYEEFISLWTDSWYMKTSKHTRQAILGHFKPKRQMMIEKWMMERIHLDLMKRYDFLTLYTTKCDEIIYTIREDIPETQYEKILNEIQSIVTLNHNLKIKTTIFEMEFLQMFTHTGASVTGFVKNYVFPKIPSTLHGVTRLYHAQLYKKWKNLPLEEGDLTTIVENQVVKFLYPLSNENPN